MLPLVYSIDPDTQVRVYGKEHTRGQTARPQRDVLIYEARGSVLGKRNDLYLPRQETHSIPSARGPKRSLQTASDTCSSCCLSPPRQTQYEHRPCCGASLQAGLLYSLLPQPWEGLFSGSHSDPSFSYRGLRSLSVLLPSAARGTDRGHWGAHRTGLPRGEWRCKPSPVSISKQTATHLAITFLKMSTSLHGCHRIPSPQGR